MLTTFSFSNQYLSNEQMTNFKCSMRSQMLLEVEPPPVKHPKTSKLFGPQILIIIFKLFVKIFYQIKLVSKDKREI